MRPHRSHWLAPLTRRSRPLVAVITALVVLLCSEWAGAADWPTRHDVLALDRSGDGGGVLDKLRQLNELPPAQTDFLPVDRAFSVNALVRDASHVVIDFRPAAGYYLYRDKLRFTIPGDRASIAQVELPPGEMKRDPNFGDTYVFHRPVTAVVTLKRSDPAAEDIVIETQYQGCADAGLCYPPEKKRFQLTFAALQSALPDSGAGSAQSSVTDQPGAGASDESSRIAKLLFSGDFWLILVSFFGFGLLLSLTPCVFPMVPILSGIIVGQGQHLRRTQAFLLSLLYVLGMAVTYAIAGIAAGLSGTLLSSSLQQPWVLAAFAALFIALALSMFGLYELQLPSALQTRLSSASNQLKGGTIGGVFLMGVLSALIVGPCVAAPLAGALLYINKTRDAVLGGGALFTMALGMGVPLLAIGLSAGTFLPKAGPWMRTVKNFFGVVLLGLAIWTLSPVLPVVVQMLLWAALLIVSATYLHAIDPLPPNASGFRKLWKGVGVIALLLGVALLIGALSGGRDLLQPLSGLRAAATPASTTQAPPTFEKVASLTDLERKLAQARGRPVMLDFYADWCISCKEMERFTFTDPGVRARMGKMVLLKADVTASTPADLELLRRFQLFGPPGTVFFDSQGRELPERVIGFQAPEPFASALDRVLVAS